MSKIILYPRMENGQQIGVVIKRESASNKISKRFTLEQIAQKDVPKGLPYKFGLESWLPKDRTFRDAWDFDFSADSDGVGADFGCGSDKSAPAEWYKDVEE